MIAKKLLRTSSLAPVDGEDVLAVLDHRLRELDARRTIVTRQIITHEKTSSERIDPSADVGQAEAMLKGAEFVLSRERPITALARLHAERQVIDRALAIGRSRQHRLATERAGDIWANHFAEIAEMEKRRVMVVLELQRVNRDREKLREKIAKAGGAGFLSTDGVELLGLGDRRDDEAEWATERVIADGICTRAEIEKAKV